jgi:hypothetical protein
MITLLFFVGCKQEVNEVIESQLNKFIVSGSVGDGPVINTFISITDTDGETITTTTSNNKAQYAIDVPSNSKFPLLVTASGGTDLVTNSSLAFTMYSVVTSSDDATVNITPFSTLVVETASALPGGLTTSNISIAMEHVSTQFNFGLNTTLIPDLINTPVNSTNVANIVKSSEALAEFLKRTKENLLTSGVDLSINNVITYLAEDLTDGVVDGLGGNADVKVAAIANVTASEVLVETLTNQLLVNDSNAITAMDNAISIIMPSAQTSTADVLITGELLTQTVAALAGSETIAPDNSLQDFTSILQSLSGNTPVSAIISSLPAGVTTAVDNAITQATVATNTQLEAINTAVHAAVNGSGGGDTGGGDTGGGDTGGGDTGGGDTGGGDTGGGDTGGGDTGGGDTGGGDTGGGGNAAPVSELISNLTVFDANTAANWIPSDNLQNGDLMYSDRTYTISGLPAEITGFAWIQTANDSKLSTLDTIASFTAQQDIVVYVGYRDDIATKASWLSSWQDSQLDLANSEPNTYSLMTKSFAAGSTVNLGNNGSADSGMYIVLIAASNTSGGGGGGGGGGVVDTATPIANDDLSSTMMNTQVNVTVLDNDTGLEDTPITVAIFQNASNGSLIVESDNSITYVPDTDYAGADSFIYQVTDTNGDMATSTVSVDVQCTNCANGSSVSLSWSPNPEAVTGYKVFIGPTVDTATTMVSDLLVSSGNFNQLAPSVTYNAWNDLNLNKGEIVCFRLKAYNSAGESGFSSAACGTIPN